MTGNASWERITELLDEALAQPPEQRVAFVRKSCGSNLELAAEIESLLDAHARAGDFGEQPAIVALRESPGVHANLDAASERRLRPGDRLGPYEIRAFVGAGGMGEVYTADDTRLHRTVAIKVLPKLSQADDFREHFQREALAVAALRHPHICVLHDIGTHEGIDYFVMEYLDGETLAERTEKGALPLDRALQYAREIAGALAHIHGHGVVHGDLKPSNIMLTASGAKLLDFGVAKLQPARTLGADALPGAHHISARSSTLGTLEYMAPEQLQGGELDGRTDLFAFGAVLYEMVTQKKAFSGKTPLAVIVQILECEPPPLEPNGSPLLQRLDQIIRRCLSKAPSQRWQTADELAATLQSLERDFTVPRQSAFLQKQVLSAVAVVVLAGLVGTFMVSREVRLDEVADADSRNGSAGGLSLGNMRMLTLDDQLETDPDISPDGRLIAYSAGTVRQRRIFIRDINGGPPVPLTPATDVPQFQPRWSPDGREILFVTSQGIAVVTAEGGIPAFIDGREIQERQGTSQLDTAFLEKGFTIHGAAWSPTGSHIAVTSGGSVDIVSRDGNDRRTVLDGHSQILHSCDWSPDGRRLACVAGNWVGSFFGNLAPSALVVMSTTGGPAIELAAAHATHLSPVWSADSNRLYFVSNRHGASDVYALNIGDDGRASSEPKRVTAGLNAHAIALSRDGRQLAYAVLSARANVWSIPIPSKGAVNIDTAHPVTTGNQTIETLRVPFGGGWLFYDSNQRGNADIYRIPIAGGVAEQITTDIADEFAPDLSVDGRLLAYHAWRTTSRDVVVRQLAGGVTEAVARSPSHETYPMWSPDGRTLAFYDASVHDGLFRGPFLVHRDQSGQWGIPQALDVARDPCRPPIVCRLSWGPDGRFLAYAHAGEVKVVTLPSGPSRVVYAPAADSEDPRAELVLVGEDNATLYFKSHDAQGRASLWSVPASGGTPALHVRFDDLARPSPRPDFAVGAGRFFFTIEDRRSAIWVANVQ